MCDSDITESCAADFTRYCPANSLCDADIGPQKRLRPQSKVRSRVAWFSRKAKGGSYPTRQGISSQVRIKPLGEDENQNDHSSCRSDSLPSQSDGEQLQWNSDSSSGDEELVALRNDAWLHEQPSSYVSPEELDALKGCVTRRRALFSPKPPFNSSQRLECDRDSSTNQPLAATAVYSSATAEIDALGGYYYPSVPSAGSDHSSTQLELPRSSGTHSPNHMRQGSFEYDHLKDFDPNDLDTLSNAGQQVHVPQLDACSVSIQFGATGYECQAIYESEAERIMLSVPHQKEEGKLQMTTITRSRSTEHDHFHRTCIEDKADSGTAGPLPLSQSIPGRLNSPSLKRGVYSGIRACHCPYCCSCGSSQRLVYDNDEVGTDRQFSSSSLMSRTNSWPRCPLARFRKDQFEISKFQDPAKGSLDRSPAPSLTSTNPSRKMSCPFAICDHTQENDSDMQVPLKVPVVLQSVDGGSTHSLKSTTSFHTHPSACTSVASLCEKPHAAYVNGVDGKVFKERTDLLLSWFGEFNDQQRNMMLLKLLEQCNCAQTHLLSVHMEPILHDGCPHNCQDLLSWLPYNIAFHILSFLDPVSLCRASQVSRSWYNMANDPKLWRTLCKLRKWQLSLVGEVKHLKLFTLTDGTVQWKEMFSERFRLRRNWLKGYCNVRTFEGHTQGISCIQFDDTRIVSGSWDKTIKVWNRRTNTAWAALTLAGHSGTVRCLHLHGNRLVSGSSDRTIKVWDLATDKVGWVGATCRATMIGHMHTVRCLQADDTKVISGSYDLTLKVWDIKTGRCALTLRGHTDAVLCLQFNDRKLVSGSKDTTIKVWSLPAGECNLTLHGHQAAVTCLQFDDTRIISGALDRLIKIWDINTGKCARTIDWIRSEGHTGVVRHLQADSWKIVSAADDKTLKVWSVHTGERLLTLKSHTDGVTCLQFNDEVIVSGSYDKTVKLWDFSAC